MCSIKPYEKFKGALSSFSKALFQMMDAELLLRAHLAFVHDLIILWTKPIGLFWGLEPYWREGSDLGN